jgi:hypothetical protein
MTGQRKLFVTHIKVQYHSLIFFGCKAPIVKTAQLAELPPDVGQCSGICALL